MADEQTPSELEDNRDKQEHAGQSINDDYDDARKIDKVFNKGRIGDEIDKRVDNAKDKIFGKKDTPETGGEQPEAPTDNPPTDDVTDATGKPANNLNNENVDATGNPPSNDLAQSTGDATGQPTNPELGSNTTDAAGNVGDKLPGTAQNATGAGEKVADTGQKIASGAQKAEKVAEAGEKVANAAGKVAQAGEAVGEGAATTAEGVSLAAAPETLGASAIVAAGIEGAKTAAKGAKEGVKLVKKGVELKEGYESAERLGKKYGKCLLWCMLPSIVGVAILFFVITKLIEMNPAVAAVQAIVSLFHKNSSEGKIAFDDPTSTDAINDNQISESSFRIMTDLSKAYDITIRYKGGISPATGQENQPYEFDLTTVDYIKCTDTATGKKDEPPIKISISDKFNWNSLVIAGKENELCAVGYYPGIESPPAGTVASAQYGPNEFYLKDIATYGPQASQQKISEAVETVLQRSAENSDKQGDFPVSHIMIPKTFYDSNLKTGQAGLGEVLKRKVTAAFPESNPDEIIISDTNTEGVHIGFD